MTDFERGMQHYKDGGSICMQKTLSAEFMNGYHLEEKNSKCGFTYQNWHSHTNYKEL